MNEEQIILENAKYFAKNTDEVAELIGPGEVKALIKPERGSHKGQNGKLLIIGGSELFHGASLWALKVASRMVDMVFYASVLENLEIAKRMKTEVLDYIAIPRKSIEEYIEEADAILIGPGMVRPKDGINNVNINKMEDLENIKDEGEQTVAITDFLLHKYPEKKWVIDAGALQVLEGNWIPKNAILTPHHQEFELLKLKVKMENLETEDQVKFFAREYNCVVALKGARDIISNGINTKYTKGGNSGMTKGGTGDVLAGIIAGFVCKNEPFLAARAGCFLNKLAGDLLFKKQNTMFNASDLVETIPEAYKIALDFN